MSVRRPSLLRALLASLVLPAVLAMGLGVVLVRTLVRGEYDELQDMSLLTKAHLLAQIYQTAQDTDTDLDALLAFETDRLSPDERTLYWFIDAQGRTVARTRDAADDLLALAPVAGLGTVQGHRIAVVGPQAGGTVTTVVALPMVERNEAIRDIVAGTLTGFLLLGALFTVAAYLAVRRTVEAIAALSRDIASKSEHPLTPVDRTRSFAELEPALDTLDALLARLGRVIGVERAFATNAAHELRTPVAIGLAHAQRLRAQLKDPGPAANALELEQALKRLSRLIERLLQMSRAQSGLGTAATSADITPVIALLMRELQGRKTGSTGLVLHPPEAPWICRADPDAVGIILGNLFDNALKYADGPLPVTVDARTPGRVRIINDCTALAPKDLAAITRRFVRRTEMSGGFGLGLSIVQDLCAQSGCTLEIRSPVLGSARGFSAELVLPPQDARRTP